MTIAFLDWSLYVECPHCEEEINLVEYDSHGDYKIAEKIFSNAWDELKGYGIECPFCHKDFEIEEVIY